MQGAVLINVTLVAGHRAEADEQLKKTVIPMIKSQPGFVATYHMATADGNHGVGLVVFDSEENAAAAAQGLNSMPRPDDAPVTIDSVQVLQVVASA